MQRLALGNRLTKRLPQLASFKGPPPHQDPLSRRQLPPWRYRRPGHPRAHRPPLARCLLHQLLVSPAASRHEDLLQCAAAPLRVSSALEDQSHMTAHHRRLFCFVRNILFMVEHIRVHRPNIISSEREVATQQPNHDRYRPPTITGFMRSKSWLAPPEHDTHKTLQCVALSRSKKGYFYTVRKMQQKSQMIPLHSHKSRPHVRKHNCWQMCEIHTPTHKHHEPDDTHIVITSFKKYNNKCVIITPLQKIQLARCNLS